jgi:ATP-dependent Clp protease, protease subunit
MLSIRNSADYTEIDIIGAIGEDWFGEGNTLETVRNQFAEINNDITVNISSLGGDLIEALAIYDMFKATNNRVTTNIIGATASAGTVIAMGGDTIKISENSLFLGHKASLYAGGNADDLRAAANDLDKFDSRLIAIYKKKTGKTKAEIENWLKEDKWITASEAKEFGLVDEVYKSKKVLNSKEVEELSKIHELPQNFIQMENNESSLKSSILALVGFKNDEVLKAENIALKEKITALEAEQPKPVDTTVFTTEIENLKSEIQAKADYDTIKAELETVKADLEKAKAGVLVIAASADPIPTNEPKVLNEGQKILADMLSNVPEDMKLIYAKKNAGN